MRLDFEQLHSKGAGALGTLGTARIHAGFHFTEAELLPAAAWDKKAARLDLSPVSPMRPQSRGHEKARIYAAVPSVPTVPQKKTIISTEVAPTGDLLNILAAFRFDLVEVDIAAGAPAAELDRTNNLCWEIMQADGLPFDQAMAIAASIVVTCESVPGESEYTDVRKLWRDLTRNQQPTATHWRKS